LLWARRLETEADAGKRVLFIGTTEAQSMMLREALERSRPRSGRVHRCELAAALVLLPATSDRPPLAPWVANLLCRRGEADIIFSVQYCSVLRIYNKNFRTTSRESSIRIARIGRTYLII
jgi:hypothetical protein